jgi:hypothetical protein
VAALERTLVTWTAAKGEAGWTARLPALAATGPVVGPGGTIYVGLEAGGLARLAPDGRLLGVEKALVEAISAPLDGSPARTLVPAQSGEVVSVNAAGKVEFRAYVEQGKPVRWVRGLGADLILVGDAATLYAWDHKGNEVWRQPVLDGSPAVADDQRVYQGDATGVSALDR